MACSFQNHNSAIRRFCFSNMISDKHRASCENPAMGCPEILIHAYDHNQYLVNRFKTFHNPGTKTVTGACKCDLIILAIGKTALNVYWIYLLL